MNKTTIKLLIALMIISIYLLSGCNEYISESEEKSNEDGSDDDNDDFDIKIIEISGMKSVDTINYAEKPVKLIVSGMNCVITVSKSTDLHEVIISGMNSIVRVSRNHSFSSTLSGMNSEIVYYD